MEKIKDSELIVNTDGSIYHLHLKPEHIADDVIVVGDPGRVNEVARFFDRIEFEIENREFLTKTGWYNNKRITVLSTGIGTDNIDIVLNELDAAVNIDLTTKQVLPHKRVLNIIRIGTSGALHADIPVDSFLMSTKGMGFDGLMHYYESSHLETEISDAFITYGGWSKQMAQPYVVSCSNELAKKFSHGTLSGITATALGFYAPQGRVLRLKPTMDQFPEMLAGFNYQGMRITNFEMETSALYGLAKNLGHHPLTICAIIANRESKTFSADHQATVRKLIQFVLNNLTM